MGEKGNERALTFASVTDLTREEEHERVKELEIIFGHYEHIDDHALRRCTNLRKLTMINCRLVRIPSLALCAVRDSLVHLSLSAQNISKMEPLDLPNLRALYLQQNRIEHIEGLHTCRRLTVLWLYGNGIKRIENLGECTDLRELWLQDNTIQTLSATEKDSGLEDLVNLETLCLAKNRIRNIDEIQALRKLVNLRSLSLVDDHFGSNPVARHPEYRTVAITTLRQMQTLDGVEIEQAERTGAVDLFLSQTLAFNDMIAELTLKYEQDLREIQTRKLRGESNATMLQRELVEALNEIEYAVVQGSTELGEEKERQLRLREQHSQMTTAAVEKLRLQYQAKMDRMLEAEMRALDEEELHYETLEQEAVAEQRLALTVATLQCTLPGKIAFEHIPEHSPDYQHFAAHLGSLNPTDGKEEGYRLLQVYRFFHDDVATRFNVLHNVDDDSPRFSQRPGEGSISCLYCALNEDEAMAVLQHGFSSTNEGQEGKWLVFFSNPNQALAFDEGAPGSCREDGFSPGESSSPVSHQPRIRSHILLSCEVLMKSVREVTIGEAKLSQLGSLRSLVSLATAAATDGMASTSSQAPYDFIHTTVRANSICCELYITSRDGAATAVLPQFALLCSQQIGDWQSFIPIRQDVVAEAEGNPEQILAAFSQEVREELKSHHDRLWREIDPGVWTRKTQQRKELEKLHRDFAQVKDQVENEKKSQRRIIKSARQRK